MKTAFVILFLLAVPAFGESVILKRYIFDRSFMTANPTLFSRIAVDGGMIDSGTIPLAALSSDAVTSLQGSGGGVMLWNYSPAGIYPNGLTGSGFGWTATNNVIYPQ